MLRERLNLKYPAALDLIDEIDRTGMRSRAAKPRSRAAKPTSSKARARSSRPSLKSAQPS